MTTKKQKQKPDLYSKLKAVAEDAGAFVSDELEVKLEALAQEIEESIEDPPDPVGPRVTADVNSDDFIYDIRDVDVRLWFMQADDQEILSLAQESWKCGYASDEVAHYMADHHAEIANMFAYLEHIGDRPSKKDECGFSCSIEPRLAMAWLDDQRPALAAQIRKIEDGEEDDETED